MPRDLYKNSIVLDGRSLKLEQLVEIAEKHRKVRLSAVAIRKVRAGRQSVVRILQSGKTVYGVNTGFGQLANVKIDSKELKELQLNLIRSHAIGVGAPLSEAEARAVMAVRLNTLLKGHSGVREEVVGQLEQFLNRGFYPEIPEFGSLGASGDLAPSAHLALCMVGEGFGFDKKKKRLPSTKLLASLQLRPLALKEKEGLAIINGTQVMTGWGCLLLKDARRLLQNLDGAAALTLEALGGSLAPFDPRIQALRPLKGQARVALDIRGWLRGSKLMRFSKRVQDAYSLRCIPQVQGAFHDALDFAASILETELNSVTDNPILFPEDEDSALNSGNFHGQPVAVALDLLGLVAAEASAFCERRIDKLLSSYNDKLPLFLSPRPGLHSGLMVAQYTAMALVTHNRILGRPAGLDNATVSAGQEDHASLGLNAAIKAKEILENTSKVIAVELLCGAQAIDLLPAKAADLGHGTRVVYRQLRKLSKKVEQDRSLAADLNLVASFVLRQSIVPDA